MSSDGFSGALTRAAGEAVGTYAIQQGTLALSTNYTCHYVGANLTITARPITVTADAADQGVRRRGSGADLSRHTGNLVGRRRFTGALTRAPARTSARYAISRARSCGTNYALSLRRREPDDHPAPDHGHRRRQDQGLWQRGSGADLSDHGGTSSLRQLHRRADPRGRRSRGRLRDHAGHARAKRQLHAVLRRRQPDDHRAPDHGHGGHEDQGVRRRGSGAHLSDHQPATSCQATASAGRSPAWPAKPWARYAITQGTLALSTNYALTYVGANLTITARPITVTADAKTKVYGDADPALSYQVTSGARRDGRQLQRGADPRGRRGRRQLRDHAGHTRAGTNYALTYVGANLTITARPITVTADARPRSMATRIRR